VEGPAFLLSVVIPSGATAGSAAEGPLLSESLPLVVITRSPQATEGSAFLTTGNWPLTTKLSSRPQGAQSRDRYWRITHMSCHHEIAAGDRGIRFSDNRQLATDNQFVIPSAATAGSAVEGPLLSESLTCVVITRSPQRPRDPPFLTTGNWLLTTNLSSRPERPQGAQSRDRYWRITHMSCHHEVAASDRGIRFSDNRQLATHNCYSIRGCSCL
jgi:hypothetical protein